MAVIVSEFDPACKIEAGQQHPLAAREAVWSVEQRLGERRDRAGDFRVDGEEAPDTRHITRDADVRHRAESTWPLPQQQ